MTLTEKWSTDNNLSTTVDVVDKLVPGLKLTLDTKFAPGTGAKSGEAIIHKSISRLTLLFVGCLKTEYKHDAAMVTADLDLGLTALNATAVMGHNGWLAGYQTCFDITKSAITKSNFGIGFSAPDFVLHTSLTNGTEFGGSVFQKISPRLETGVSLGWSSANSVSKFGIGAKYVLDGGASVRAKVNNSSEIGLGYQQKLRDGVTLTLSTLVNGANFNAVYT